MKVVSKDAQDKEVTVFVRKPTAKDNQESKLYGNQLAAQIMLKKDDAGKPTFITRNQIRNILRESGRLSEADEKRIGDLSDDINGLEKQLTKGGIKKSDGRVLALMLRDKRNQLLLSLMSINELDEHTLEYEVENAVFDYLVYLCSTTEDGEKLFSSVDDYKEKADDEPYAYEAANALKIIMYGTTKDIMKDNIENKFLLKYNFINEDLQLVDKDGQLVDRDGNRINDKGEPLDSDGNVVKTSEPEVGDFLDDEEVEPVVDTEQVEVKTEEEVVEEKTE